MTPHEAAAALDAAGHAGPDARLDMARLALAMSVLEQPERTVGPHLSHLDEIATRFQGEAAHRPAESLAAILAGEFGYEGDSETYDDMINADMAAVIDRRRGLPVALGILYCHAARAAGWDAAGLSFPAHFLIRVDGPAGRHVVDPFHGGRTLHAGDLRAMLRTMGAGQDLATEHHQDVPDRHVLLRLQNNIKLRRLKAGDLEGGLAVLARMRRLAPDVGGLAMEEAATLAEMGAIKGAVAGLRDYLNSGHATVSDRAEMERFLAQVETRLN